MVVIEVGVVHTKWGEDVVVRKLAEGLARDAFDYFGHEEVTGVAVFVLFARWKVEVFLAGNEFEEVGIVVGGFGGVDA